MAHIINTATRCMSTFGRALNERGYTHINQLSGLHALRLMSCDGPMHSRPADLEANRTAHNLQSSTGYIGLHCEELDIVGSRFEFSALMNANASSIQLIALVLRNLLSLVPLRLKLANQLQGIDGTHMFMNTSIEPLPSVRSRVLRVRHIRTRIKAPSGARLAPDLVSITEKRPNGSWSVRVAWVMLL